MSTLTADPLPIFPRCPTFGFQSTPAYRVVKTERDGGFRRRDRKWKYPLHSYSGVPLGNQTESDMQDVLYFSHALGGQSSKFLFKDWNDYKSCRVNETPDGTNFAPVEPIGSDSPVTSWQLVKAYTFGSITQLRPIRHLTADTIHIYNGSGTEQSDFTLDLGTGILTIGGSFSGAPGFWHGEFFVPVTFAEETSFQIVDHKIVSASISIEEEREGSST